MLLTCRSGGMAMLVYVVSLVMNLVTTKLDDKLSLHSVNATIFDSMTTQDLETEFSVWKGLNYCRCLGFILGWFLVALRPSTDLLQKHLRKLVHKRGTPEKNGLSNHGFVGWIFDWLFMCSSTITSEIKVNYCFGEIRVDKVGHDDVGWVIRFFGQARNPFGHQKLVALRD